MRAFINCKRSKEELVAQLRAHQLADEIVQGIYWEGGKGCAVGCAVHSNNHMLFESEYGIEWRIAWLCDDLFECLPHQDAKLFPLRFAEAIPVGADLSHVYDQWCAWMLGDPTHGLIKISDEPSVKAMADLFARASRGDEPSNPEWESVSTAAMAARDAMAAWDARAARDARDARDARGAMAARAARAALAARVARATWSRAAADKFIELLGMAQ